MQQWLTELGRVWVEDNDLLYAGIIRDIDYPIITVYKYALGLYIRIRVGEKSLQERKENISYDIFLNRQNFIAEEIDAE